MTEDELNRFRAKRLAELLNAKFEGNKSALGKALGYQGGAFVRQMIDGERAITEKTVLKIHSLRGCKGWMNPDSLESVVTEAEPRAVQEAPEAVELVRFAGRFLDALDPVLLPSARAVLHQFIDGTVGEDEAAVSLQKLFALSSPETNRRFADIRSSLDLPGPGGTARATKFATR